MAELAPDPEEEGKQVRLAMRMCLALTLGILLAGCGSPDGGSPEAGERHVALAGQPNFVISVATGPTMAAP